MLDKKQTASAIVRLTHPEDTPATLAIIGFTRHETRKVIAELASLLEASETKVAAAYGWRQARKWSDAINKP